MSPETGSLVGTIVGALEDDLLSGVLMPGERLDERKLAARFGVSRTPVREALQRLAANGIVTQQARQAALVVQLDLPDLFDCFMVNAELEAIAATQATRRIRPGQRSELEAAHEACTAAARSGDYDAFNEANARFHRVIVESSHNRLLTAHIRNAQLLTAPYRLRITYQPGRMAASLVEHEQIMAAILRNDSTAAAEHMRRHVDQLAAGASDFLHHLRMQDAIAQRG